MTMLRAAILLVFLFAPAANGAGDFLANWMGQLSEVLAKQSLLDLTLPGTHDTMTYDLSETISDGGIDDEPELASLLHDFPHLPGVNAFIRQQAQTQALTVSQQLDAGIRFLDFRVMYTAGVWRCLHMLQSNEKSLLYLQEIRNWLDAHPTEVIAIWLSKHGSVCKTGDAQYPGVSKETKQTFWKEIEGVFSGLLLDTAESSLKDTGMSDLVKRNHRVIVFASDFEEFTGGQTTLATDGCLVDNPLSMSSVDGLSLTHDLGRFKAFSSDRDVDKPRGKFLLESMAGEPPISAIKGAAKVHLMPGGTKYIQSCAIDFHIPGMTQWCPENLMDVAQLKNYYSQRSIDAAYDASYEFPNAIYIDAVGPGGVIRTGTRLLSSTNGSTVCDIYKWTSCSRHRPSCGAGWTANGDKATWNCYDYDGKSHGVCVVPGEDHYKCCRDDDGNHATDAYAYADTLIAVNVRRACGTGPSPSQQCSSAASMLEVRRARFPMTEWSDALTGRLLGWPKETASVYV